MRRGESLLVAAEVGLAAVTLGVVLGMDRLFADSAWVGPIVANTIAAHLLVTACRRRGLSLTVTAAAMTVGAVLVGVWSSYWSTTTAGVPTGDTWSAISSDLGDAWNLYQDVVAPAPALPGFVLASAVAVWAVAYVADWAAFRLWVPFEATLPAGTLFLFTALLGTSGGRAGSIAMYAGSLVAFLLLHRLTRQDGTSHWVGDRRGPGHRSLLIAGSALGVVAVVVGTLFGPSLPGASSAGVLDPRDIGDDGGSREVVSPLVDIRARLIHLSATELFRVTASQPSYWRMTSLERFDGTKWWSSGSYDEGVTELPATLDEDVTVQRIEQAFSITALSTIWLPSAYEPRAIDSHDVGVLYDEESGTLIVDRELTTSDGLTYDVVSDSPRLTKEDLEDKTPEYPGAIRDTYLALPDDFSEQVRTLSEEVTASVDTPYEQAVALQRHLRTFTYDLETVSDGHSTEVLEDFLFTTRRGYCEQFAGAYAAMARSIGLPARVAVGFTQGEPSATDPNVYVVRGEHAHAWPEVYIANIGWVAFEPTPGRGMPFAEDYTGVQPAQASPGDPQGVVQTPSTESDTTLPTTPSGDPGQSPRGNDLETNLPQGQGDGGSRSSSPVVKVLRPVGWLSLGLVVTTLLYLVLFPVFLLWLRARRRRLARAGSPADRIGLAWREAAEATRVLGYEEHTSETFKERADRLAHHYETPGVGDAAANLAHRLEIAAYSREGADDLEAELAEEDWEVIASAMRAEASWRARVKAWVDPRPLVREWRQRRSITYRHITTPVPATSTNEPDAELVTAGASEAD